MIVTVHPAPVATIGPPSSSSSSISTSLDASLKVPRTLQARGYTKRHRPVAFRRSLYRTISVPFMRPFVQRESIGSGIRRVFSFESFPILFIFLLGFTEGFNAACSMALGPQTLSSDHGIRRARRNRKEDIEMQNHRR